MPEGPLPFSHILDTSAILCYLADEPAASRVAEFRSRAAVPFVSYSELYYLVWRRRGKAEADKVYALVRQWRLPLLVPDERVILSAGRIKALYRLGLADSYIAAFSAVHQAVLVTLDADFLPLRGELPLKKI